MNRYKKANEGIHVPEEVKKRVSPKPQTRAKWVGAVAAVLVLALVGGILFWPGNAPVAHAAGLIARAEYPTSVLYPDEQKYLEADDWEGLSEAMDLWSDERRARRDMAPEEDGLQPFYAALLPQLLGNAGENNAVCSPLNIYMALAMLAETTGGSSRQQILDLLNTPTIEVLRERAHGLWNANYQNDGAHTSVLTSSLWLNETVGFRQDTMDRLADTYYASSFQGEMGSAEYNKALQDWLNEQTGGLLKEYADNIELDPNTVLALATTIYFQMRWRDEFSAERNTEDVFHGAAGDTTATFMHQKCPNVYYWGDSFGACRSLLDGGAMWFLLPDEGVSVDELLADSQVMDFLYAPHNWEQNKYLIVNFAMPKFDISAETDLAEGLQALGVTDVFDPALADFTPMTDLEDVYLSQATHAARVAADEEGVTAAAYTVMAVAGAGAPPDEVVDFVLDRPFLFAITGDMGQLLFVGVVNQV